ncbi:MAG: hypothetical protein ACRD96_16685 [Bryobacteraceae bacterium]
MDGRRYIEIPGDGTHELPPLLVNHVSEALTGVVDVATAIVEADEIIAGAGADFEQRKLDLALHLVDRYHSLLAHWQWGDSILEWIRQCEITFETSAVLRRLLHPDVWPHASRSSFVTLLEDKAVPTHGVAIEQAVGLRLTFRQPPPIDCFSDRFLILLNSPVADSAYQSWARLSADASALLPPERFHFQVHELN